MYESLVIATAMLAQYGPDILVIVLSAIAAYFGAKSGASRGIKDHDSSHDR